MRNNKSEDQKRGNRKLIKGIKIEYSLVECSICETFKHTVNMLLNEGWKLAGGVSVVLSMRGYKEYAQALTREIDIDEDEEE